MVSADLRERAPDLFRVSEGAVMGHRSSRRASLPFRVLTVGVVVCTGLIVSAIATALPATSAVEAPPLAGAAASVGVNECYRTHNGDPRLVEFRYGPRAVDVVDAKAHVRFRMRVRDTGGPGPATGVRSVMVWFGRTEAGESLGTEGQKLTKAAGGWWTGSVTVPRKAPHRRWPVEGLVLRDRAGNTENYSRAALTKILGRAAGVSITTAPDRTPPHLTAFSVTPKSVDSRAAVGYVTFTARMVDVQSDVNEVVVDGAGDTSWLSRDRLHQPREGPGPGPYFLGAGPCPPVGGQSPMAHDRCVGLEFGEPAGSIFATAIGRAGVLR